jgi:hypothetical protein
MRTKFQTEVVQGIYHLEDLGIDGHNINVNLKEVGSDIVAGKR